MKPVEKKNLDILSSCILTVEGQGTASKEDQMRNKNEVHKEASKPNWNKKYLKHLLWETYNTWYEIFLCHSKHIWHLISYDIQFISLLEKLQLQNRKLKLNV